MVSKMLHKYLSVFKLIYNTYILIYYVCVYKVYIYVHFIINRFKEICSVGVNSLYDVVG